MRGQEPAADTVLRAAAILLAAGSSVRLGFDKVWADLNGQPLIAHPLRVLAETPVVETIVVVTRPGSEKRIEELAAELGIRAIVVPGGERRQDSVRAGLRAIPDAEWVIVHDGARPLLTSDLLMRGLAAAAETGAAIAAVPATDTIKVVSAGRVVSTPPREQLWLAQTPQVFRRSLLEEAHRLNLDVTDDAALVEALGVGVRVFEGAYGNIKVTSEADLRFVRLALRSEAEREGQEISRAGSHQPR